METKIREVKGLRFINNIKCAVYTKIDRDIITCEKIYVLSISGAFLTKNDSLKVFGIELSSRRLDNDIIEKAIEEAKKEKKRIYRIFNDKIKEFIGWAINEQVQI